MTPSVSLRPYQQAARERIWEEFQDHGRRSTLLVLPTGCGKTITFGSVARDAIDQGGRVLVLAHRGELLTQAANSLATIGVEAAIEKAEQSARCGALLEEPSCVVASVQTMQGKRLRSWARGHFRLIITDEAHHAPAGSYQAIYDHFDAPWHLGVTATADRLDKENLGQVFQSVAYQYSLREAIEEGWLSRISVVRCETDVDLSAIRTTAGDLNQADIEAAIAPHVEELANAIRQEIGNRRTIVFTPDVGSSDAMASALRSLGFAADSIAGSSRDRKEILARFHAGKSRILCNCNLLTEGFDAPFVQAIVLARPTKSRSLYCQMVGRGTRLFPGKEDCLVVDFAWLTGRHKLVTPVELFDTTKLDPEVKAVADAMVDTGDATDLMEAIEKADKAVDAARERRRLEVEAEERQARYRRVAYDPFAAPAALGLPAGRESEWILRARPSEKQVAMLKDWGVQGVDAMSKSRATQTIGILMERRAKGLASLKQVDVLIRNGIEPEVARSMPREEASVHLDRIIGNRRHAS